MRSPRHFLLLISFASGAAALVYQVVWLHWFKILFGSTAYAASATLCAFFVGLAIGSAIFGRIAAGSKRPLLLYAILEFTAAAAALLVPLVFHLYDYIYPALYAHFADQRDAFLLVKFALAMLVMVPPAILLGGTLPLLASGYVSNARALGREGGLLYALNTFGAALGTAIGALWLPEVIGVRATYAVGIVLSITCGLAAALCASEKAPFRIPLAPNIGDASPAPVSLLAIAFASGFGTLALEVFLIQSLARIVDHTVYSYGAVLVVVLLALTAGAALVSATANRLPARPILGAVLALEAIMLLVLPKLFERLTYLGGTGLGALLDTLWIAAVFGGPPMLIGGLVLPLTFRIGAGGSVGRRLGGLLAANTMGGILGSIAASFVFLELLGLWTSIAAIGIGYAALAIMSEGTTRERVARGAAVTAALLLVFAGPANPLNLPQVWLKKGESLMVSAEGAYGVVSVVEDDHTRRMKLNNHYTLSGSGGKLDALKERAGHLPLLLHPDPKRVLFVGSATGNTAGAAVRHPVDDIVLVEIVPEVQEFAAAYFTQSNNRVHHDPRTRLVVEDGRNHLRATDERYDVIVSDLFSPWRPGVGSLYTREHFAAVKSRLTTDGVFCQWLPIYQLDFREFSTIAATFLEVYPNATLWRGDFYASYPRVALMGYAGTPLSAVKVEERSRKLASMGVQDRWVTDPRGLWMLYVGPLKGAEKQLAGVTINTDNNPIFEFIAGQSTGEGRSSFRGHGWRSFANLLIQAGENTGKPYGEQVMVRAHAGAAIVEANTLFVQERSAEFRVARSKLNKLIPADLMTPPDPTVADMWFAKP